jgi:hypothetical protein
MELWIAESNFTSTEKSLFEIGCRIRTDWLPAVQRSCVVPAGTLSSASEPFALTVPSPTGFTTVHTLVLRLLVLKSSDTGGPDAADWIVVGSLAESLLVFVSPPPETVAVLVTVAGALLATPTVSVTAAELVLPGIDAELVHVTVWPEILQLQPLPVAAVAVSPVGTESVITTLPLEPVAAMFRAVKV